MIILGFALSVIFIFLAFFSTKMPYLGGLYTHWATQTKIAKKKHFAWFGKI